MPGIGFARAPVTAHSAAGARFLSLRLLPAAKSTSLVRGRKRRRKFATRRRFIARQNRAPSDEGAVAHCATGGENKQDTWVGTALVAVRKTYTKPLPAFKSKDNHKLPTRFAARQPVPRRGFPTPKQSTGLFRLPSCAFVKKEISLRAQSDQKRCLWILPPLKRRAKLYMRADSSQIRFFSTRPKGLYL